MIKLKSLLSEQAGTNWGTPVEQVLKYLGAYPKTTRKSLPVVYHLDDIVNQKGIPIYKIRFNSDGTADRISNEPGLTAESFKFSINPANKYNILVSDNENRLLGTIIKSKKYDRAMWMDSAEVQAWRDRLKLGTSDDPRRGENKWSPIDITQSVLDWAGFIPGAGDGLDLINAAIYFVRWGATGDSGFGIDGALSLIGAIPFVGSVASTALKQGVKNNPVLKKALRQAIANPDEAAKFWEIVVKNGILSPKILDGITAGMGDIAKWLIDHKAGLVTKTVKYTGTSEPMVRQVLDQFIKFANETKFANAYTRNLDQLSSAELAARTAEKVRVGKARKFIPGETVKILGRVAARLGNNILGFFGPEQLKRANALLVSKFKSVMLNDPEKVATLLDLAPTSMKKTITDQINELVSNNIEKFSGMDTVKAAGTEHFVNNLHDFIVELSSKNKDLYRNISADIVNKAADAANNHIAWTIFSTDSMKRLGSLASFEGLGLTGKQFYKELVDNLKEPRKWADILGDEFEEWQEAFQLDNADGTPDSTLTALVQFALRKLSPETYKSAATWTQNVASPAVKWVRSTFGLVNTTAAATDTNYQASDIAIPGALPK